MTLIHSVDSERLLAEINNACAAASDMPPVVDILLEVNTSGESAKHGLAPDEVATTAGRRTALSPTSAYSV